MANWRQIQARIRKARASGQPAESLAQLFEKTRDAMVAFELGRLHEKATQADEAARWYRTAAERFRRADWKKKAEEALQRLGAAPVAADMEGQPEEELSPAGWAEVEAAAPVEEAAPAEADAEDEGVPSEAASAEPQKKKRRRGRRGGRGRRRKTGAGAAVRAPAATPAVVTRPVAAAPIAPRHEPEPMAPAAQMRGRAGDPGLASRIAGLESLLRRLLGSPLYHTDDVEHAPAGPGVIVLSDADMTAYYHVEACRTIRIALGKAVGSERGGGVLRSRLARHLGISEARAAKYLKEHCAVRWLQLDVDAASLAHFAAAVLRPVLDEE